MLEGAEQRAGSAKETKKLGAYGAVWVNSRYRPTQDSFESCPTALPPNFDDLLTAFGDVYRIGDNLIIVVSLRFDRCEIGCYESGEMEDAIPRNNEKVFGSGLRNSKRSTASRSNALLSATNIALYVKIESEEIVPRW